VVALLGSGLAMLAAFAAIYDWATSVGPPRGAYQPCLHLDPGRTGAHLERPPRETETSIFSFRLDSSVGGDVVFRDVRGVPDPRVLGGYMHTEGERSYARYFAYLKPVSCLQC